MGSMVAGFMVGQHDGDEARVGAQAIRLPRDDALRVTGISVSVKPWLTSRCNGLGDAGMLHRAA